MAHRSNASQAAIPDASDSSSISRIPQFDYIAFAPIIPPEKKRFFGKKTSDLDPYAVDLVKSDCGRAQLLEVEANKLCTNNLATSVEVASMKAIEQQICAALELWKLEVEGGHKQGAREARSLIQTKINEYQAKLRGTSERTSGERRVDKAFTEAFVNQNRVRASIVLASHAAGVTVPKWPPGFRQRAMHTLDLWIKFAMPQIYYIYSRTPSSHSTVLYNYASNHHSHPRSEGGGRLPPIAGIDFHERLSTHDFERQFVSTVMWQLADCLPDLKPAIVSTVGKDLANSASPLWMYPRRQLQELLVAPYTHVRTGPFYILLDNLNRCSTEVLDQVLNFMEDSIAAQIPVLYAISHNGDYERCWGQISKRTALVGMMASSCLDDGDPVGAQATVRHGISSGPVSPGSRSANQRNAKVRSSPASRSSETRPDGRRVGTALPDPYPLSHTGDLTTHKASSEIQWGRGGLEAIAGGHNNGERVDGNTSSNVPECSTSRLGQSTEGRANGPQFFSAAHGFNLNDVALNNTENTHHVNTTKNTLTLNAGASTFNTGQTNNYWLPKEAEATAPWHWHTPPKR